MATVSARADFQVDTSTGSLGYRLPHRLGRILWLPMLAGALAFFGAGMALGVIRAGEISDGGAADTIATLQHLQAGFTSASSARAAARFRRPRGGPSGRSACRCPGSSSSR
jgi:hypothetical protein